MRRLPPSQSATSSLLATASPPAAVISSTTSWAASPRSFTTTLAPSAANRRAYSRPIPRPAPVMMAIRPSSAPMSSASLCRPPAPWRVGGCARRVGRFARTTTTGRQRLPGAVPVTRSHRVGAPVKPARRPGSGGGNGHRAVHPVPQPGRLDGRGHAGDPGPWPAEDHVFRVPEMGDGTHLATLGIVDADPGADVAGGVEGQYDDVATDPAELVEFVIGEPRLVVVREDDDLGIHPGHDVGQGRRHRASTVEGAAGARIAELGPLACHAVVLRGVPGHQRLPHVVVRVVPVLVVRGVEVGEVHGAEPGRPDQGAGVPAHGTPGTGQQLGYPEDEGAVGPGSPLVESTRSAASRRLVRSTGHSGLPAYSASMASRTASMRAPLAGRKNRESVQNVSVT